MGGKLGVGIMGLEPEKSWAAVAHIPALRALADDFEIVAVSNRSQQSAEAAAAHYGIPHAFDSVEKLCACPGVDVVAVTVKVPHHLALVRAAVAAGKHIYCEWPLGNGIAEAREMTALAEAAGIVATCGMQARFSPVLAYAADLVRGGYVGDILSVTVVANGLNWGATVNDRNAYTADISYGATMLSIPVGHTIDGLAPVIGEIAELQATLANARTSVQVIETGETLPMTAHDEVLFNGRLASGAPISLHYRGGTPRGTGLLIEINGSAGDLQITGPGGHTQLLDLELRGARGGDLLLAPLPVPDSYTGVTLEGGCWTGNVARFYRQLALDIRTGSRGCPTFADAVVRHQVVEAVMASAEQGVRIRTGAM